MSGAIGMAIKAVASTAQNVANSIKEKKMYSRQLQEARMTRQAERQNFENERMYNSPIAQTMRYKDAGFNPNAFMNNISPGNMDSLPAVSSAPQPTALPVDAGGIMDGVSQYMQNENDVLIAQMQIQSAQKIAAQQVEYNYWAQQIRTDTQFALQTNQQEYGLKLQKQQQTFEAELQSSRLKFTAQLQKNQQAFESAQNEKDRDIAREKLSQSYQMFSEELAEKQRVNTEEINALHTKMALARQENARKETISMYEQELKSKEIQAQTIANQKAQFEADWQGVDKAFEYAGDVAEIAGKFRGSSAYERQVNETSRHNQANETETKRHNTEMEQKDVNRDKARRYDANKRYEQLIREGYTRKKAYEIVQKEFGL